MVNTRSTTQRIKEEQRLLELQQRPENLATSVNPQCDNATECEKYGEQSDKKVEFVQDANRTMPLEGSEIKHAVAHRAQSPPLQRTVFELRQPDLPYLTPPLGPPHMQKDENVATTSKVRSKISKSSSKSSRRRYLLQLEAAEAKARIDKELIDMRLQFDLAGIDNDPEYSSHSEEEDHDLNRTKTQVEQWLNLNQKELDKLQHSTHPQVQTSSKMPPLIPYSCGAPPLRPPQSAYAYRAPPPPPPKPQPHGCRAPAPPMPFPVPQPAPHDCPVPAPQPSKPLQPQDSPSAPTAYLTPPQPAPAPKLRDGTEYGAVQLLASAIKDLTAATAPGTNAHMLSRLSTPRDLPTFAGEPLDWLYFKQAYEESTQVCNFTEKENLWRLRKCLHGPAKDAVSALLISATSPATIMSTLELQFGNPDIILSRIMHDINKLQPLPPDYHKEIVSFAVKVQNYVAAVNSIGQSEYLRATNVISILLSKMPTVLISKWADYSYFMMNDDSKPKLILLSEFLTAEAQKITKTSVNFIAMTSSDNVNRQRKQTDYNRPQQRHNQSVLVHSETSNVTEKCGFCKLSVHKLTECKKFKKSLRKARWNYVKRNRVCFKCLISKHNREHCPAPACDTDNCGQSHHRLLHCPISARQYNNNVSENHPEDPSPQVESETVTHVKINDCKVLLKTVPIDIYGPNGKISAVALLNDGSTVSLISSSLASRVGLRGTKHTMRVSGAWSDIVCESEIVDFNVSNKDGTMFTLRARTANELNLPMQHISIENSLDCDYVNKISDQLCVGRCKPEILLGQDNYHVILPLQIFKGKPNEPYVTRTPLGWCIHGPTRMPSHHATAHSTLFLTEDQEERETESDQILRDLSEEVRRSFSLDSLGVTNKPRQNSDDVRALEHLEKTSKLIDGRWYVGLPWKNATCKLPDSYPTALMRLKGVQRKIRANEGYADRYNERIQHLLQNNYAQEIKNMQNTPRTWYLPHFGVDNANKKKLRLVFDAASKSSGLSLNDYLLTGPDLLMSLYGIMLRFRENKIAVAGDIKDMFLRVKIIPEDQDALRFLWKDLPESTNPESTESPIKTYKMTSLIFGANCSPFVAQFIKNKNALRFKHTMPQAVQAICEQHYMDDYIQSLPDENTAIKQVNDITYIHSQGGFEIRNWMSNSTAVLNNLPNEALATSALRFKIGLNDESERTLGLLWFPKEDLLGFDVSFKKIPQYLIDGQKKPTKREILRVVMSIFDVYGFLSPFTIKGKIILQQTWKHDLGWDDVVPADIYNKWVTWLQQLKTIHIIRLPRHYQGQANCEWSENEKEDSLSRTHSEATSATPPLQATPGSLEQYKPVAHHPATPAPPADAATPSPRSDPTCNIKNYDESLTCPAPPPPPPPTATPLNGYRNLQLHIFCDASTQAMCAVAYWRWINNNGNIQLAFVSSKCRVTPTKYTSMPRLELQAAVLAARLAHTLIKEHNLTPHERYFWSDSSTVLHWIRNTARTYKQFIAHRLGEIDELTQINEWRYVPTKSNVADLATRDNCDLSVLEAEWFYGPSFLYENKESWPADTYLKVREEDLEFVNLLQTTDDLPAVPNPERFSSWTRLLKTTSMVLLFINKCRKLTTEVDGDMMRRAERLLIRFAQMQSFPEDLEHLKNKKQLEKKSKLLTLSPYVDEYGILRVGGRIDAAPGVPTEIKHPVILDGRSHVARLIVRSYHIKFAHAFQETLVNEIKQKYWITRLRPTIKNVISACMLCRIKKARPQPPRMGDLPEARMSHHQRPFTFCGLDLFGPMEVTVCRRREKRYGVLFTCLTVRAIHIEIVTKLTSDALIMALRRMAARRGWPLQLFSDNGTNLRGADTELKRSIQELDTELLKQEAVNYGTTWKFIPPTSPHWGGAWERMIRSVKDSLNVVLRERAPRDEVLNTLMTEVEQIVNSRPLTHVAVEPHTDESLTPNHFLLGSSSNLPILGNFDDSDLYLRKQWRTSQRLADLFWQRWLREILPEMRPRTKWHEDQGKLQVGDLVLIIDPASPRNVWPRGKVERVMPGKDGRIRVVEVRTKSGLLQRSATRVARIPMGDEC